MGPATPAEMSTLIGRAMHPTYFKFEDKFYGLLKGITKGSPMSGFIAKAVIQKLERTVLSKIKPKFWLRSEDDTFVINKRSEVEPTILFYLSLPYTIFQEGAAKWGS